MVLEKNYSTELALLHFTDKIINELDKSKYTSCIFFGSFESLRHIKF